MIQTMTCLRTLYEENKSPVIRIFADRKKTIASSFFVCLCLVFNLFVFELSLMLSVRKTVERIRLNGIKQSEYFDCSRGHHITLFVLPFPLLLSISVVSFQRFCCATTDNLVIMFHKSLLNYSNRFGAIALYAVVDRGVSQLQMTYSVAYRSFSLPSSLSLSLSLHYSALRERARAHTHRKRHQPFALHVIVLVEFQLMRV